MSAGDVVREPDRGLELRERVVLLGIPIDRLRRDDLFRFVVDAVRDRLRASILYVNVHCMNVAAHDADYARIVRLADLVYCDGTGVRLGAWLAGYDVPARMTGADWIGPLCDVAAAHGLSLYLLGGGSDVARDAARILERRHAGLRIAGAASGFQAGSAALAQINETRPDILLVGMGTPKQEKWIFSHRGELDVPVVWAVGALFDFVSGRIPRGPRWLTDHGLEWLCRFAAEPRKLWRRYLIGNPLFLFRIIRRYWFCSHGFGQDARHLRPGKRRRW